LFPVDFDRVDFGVGHVKGSGMKFYRPSTYRSIA